MDTYEKKYKESMAKMSTFLAKHDGFTISKDGEMYKELSEIFPELKESEDNIIIKALKSGFKMLEREYNLKGLGGIKFEKILTWLEKQGNKDEEILVLKDQIESLHAAIKALKEAHKIELEKQCESIDKIVKRATTEKQRVLLTESDGVANIDWDTRSIQDVKLLLEYGLDYIKKLEKQGEQKPYGQREECSNCQMNYAGQCKGSCAMKRGEQKPAEVSKQEDIKLTEFEDALYTTFSDIWQDYMLGKEINVVDFVREHSDELLKIANKQKPTEWTAEDEEELKIALNTLEEAGQYSSAKWLKNVCLVPQNRWKPSDEQLKALKEAIDEHFDIDGGALWHLYEDLKKLKG